MHECPASHPALRMLFDPNVPDNPVLWAVLKGHHAGRALVDDDRGPSQCVLRTEAVLAFSSRQVSQPFLDEAIDYFKQAGPVWLVWPASLASRLIAPATMRSVQRLEFYDYDSYAPVLAGWRAQLSEGFEIRPIDRDLLECCEWRSEMEFYCGSLDNFLVNGIGLCLMKGKEIIAETYASSLGEGMAEIGAITREAYRGQGYAPIACAYLISACEKRGYRAYWSCDADNLPSIRVAQKLGFRQGMAYEILEYDPLS